MFLQLLRSKIDIKDINIENAKAVARWIKRQFPEVTVYIIGSVLRPDLIHSGSDIDIIIKGIDGVGFDTLIKKIHHEFPSLRIDIRRMEELDSYTQQKIIKKAIIFKSENDI